MHTLYEHAYKFRGVLMAPPYLFLTIAYLTQSSNLPMLWWAGLLLFGGGVTLRVWAQMHLHYRLRVRKRLTRTGPYAYVRNPIYIGNTLMLLGVTLISQLWWFLPVMLLWCILVYGLVVRREEAHLSQKYGDFYLHFLKEVPRWLPRAKKKPLPTAAVASFFWPSVGAEMHCLLWLCPYIFKVML